MYLGKIVEIGPARQIIERPKHPYTQALVSAVPVPDPTFPRSKPRIREGVPRATHLPTGCHFYDRCPDAVAVCREVAPPWVKVGRDQYALCHLYGAHAPSNST